MSNNHDVAAIDEYLANLLEKNGYVTPSVWDRIRFKLKSLMSKAGFNIALTNADVKYLFWKSHRALSSDRNISEEKMMNLLGILKTRIKNTIEKY